MATAVARSTAAPKPAAARSGTVVIGERGQVRVPAKVVDLATFREWGYSDEFPEIGRISFLRGDVWVDLSMEQLYSHNLVKTRITMVLSLLIDRESLGYFFSDGAQVTNAPAGVSNQPDGTFVSYEAVRGGRVRLVEGKEVGYVELDGSPEMVMEIVSKSSEKKDTKILHRDYWNAGIAEYWLIDARGEKLQFEIFRRGRSGFTATRRQAGGWIRSGVFARSFRLTQGQDPLGFPKFSLEVRS